MTWKYLKNAIKKFFLNLCLATTNCDKEEKADFASTLKRGNGSETWNIYRNKFSCKFNFNLMNVYLRRYLDSFLHNIVE